MKNLRMIIIMLGCLLCGVAAQGQEMVVDGFRELPGYIVKNTDMSKRRVDANGHLPALVLVSIASEEAKFSGQIVGPVEKREGEYCVYMVGYQGGGAARNLTVIVPGYKPLHVEFAPYGYKQLNEDTAYRLSITLTGSQNKPVKIYSLNLNILGKSYPLNSVKVYRNKKSDTVYDEVLEIPVNNTNHTTKTKISALVGDRITVESDDFYPETMVFGNSMITDYTFNLKSTKRQIRFRIIDEFGDPLIGAEIKQNYNPQYGAKKEYDFCGFTGADGCTKLIDYKNGDKFIINYDIFTDDYEYVIDNKEHDGGDTIDVVLKESGSNRSIVNKGGRQYTGMHYYGKAMSLLFSDELSGLEPYVVEYIYYVYHITDDVAEKAFEMFQEIASNNDGYVAWCSMRLIVSMEMSGIGCGKMTEYEKSIDLATYFMRYHGYLKFKKFDDEFYTISRESLDDGWKIYKKHPYVNDNKSKGYWFLRDIVSDFRPMANWQLPYIARRGDLFGYVSQDVNKNIPCKYTFGYPFDPKTKLAAVEDDNNKWGFIDEYGRTVIPHIYDIVNDVFVDDKNIVIKDNHLVLINTRGEELKSIFGYSYIYPQCKNNEIIAFNGLKNQFDAFDFYGNMLEENCLDKEKGTRRGLEEWLGDYRIRDDVNGPIYRLPSVPISISMSDLTEGDAVDLGTGVLWGTKNLGAESCADIGDAFLWGNSTPLGNEYKSNVGKKYQKELLKKGLPKNIAGTEFDMATSLKGAEWRLPTEEDFKRLIDECTWSYAKLGNCMGYRVVGKNGNAIFFPLDNGKLHGLGQNRRFWNHLTFYWSSERYPYESKTSIESSGLAIEPLSWKGRVWIEDLCYWNFVRPIKVDNKK